MPFADEQVSGGGQNYVEGHKEGIKRVKGEQIKQYSRTSKPLRLGNTRKSVEIDIGRLPINGSAATL